MIPALVLLLAASTPSVVGLRCEYAHDPLGIDVARPRLSWRLESPRRGERQAAYQVLVATGVEALAKDRGDLWDSGRVASDQSLNVEYAGQPLGSRQRALWKVRVWGADGNVSPWSRTASWEMGLLQPGDWQAQWIGLPPAAVPAGTDAPVDRTEVAFVRFPEAEAAPADDRVTRCFRASFDLPAGRAVSSASLLIAADNAASTYVNGRPTGEIHAGWNRTHLVQIGVTDALRPGRNVVAIAVTHLFGRRPTLAAVLQVRFADGPVQSVATGPGWKAGPGEARGWTSAAFDDSAWPSAQVAAVEATDLWQVRRWKPSATRPATYLRREFSLARAVRRARVYASAKGLYTLLVNGQPVSADLLRPGWTDYRDRFQYQAYDVTPLVKEGRNAVAAVVGDGWYSGYVGGWGRENWGRAKRALVQLELELADGTATRVVSDGDWRAATGPILAQDLLMGEDYDARLEAPGWDRSGFDDRSWTRPEVEPLGSVPLVAQVGPAVRRVTELRPVAITERPGGSFVFDLGQNMVGWVRLSVRGPAGATVRLRHAEMLKPDGTIYTTNLRAARATDTYTLKGGGPETWEPSLTFHGFRYVELTGYPGTPGNDAVTGVVISTATPPTGVFETSSPLVNQLQHNIVWGQRGNYLEVPTDCPQRDERLGWMGDAEVFARTACFNSDVASFLTKWSRDVGDAQTAAGAFSDYAPDIDENHTGAPAWADAGVIVPWQVYRCYGDTRLLADQYDAARRFIAFVKDANPGLIWRERSGNNYGDWLNIGADAPRDVLATAYFANSARLVSKMAAVLGKADDARVYEQLFQQVRGAFQREFVGADVRIKGDTQTVYLLALRFDLLPETQRALAADHLVKDIEKRGTHLSTGFLGVSHLNPVLTEIGRLDLAYKLLLNDTFPSWGYSIKQGATTIWERWDGWTAEKGFQDPGMNSFNHYSLGSVGEWLYAVVGGIDLDPELPGYKRFVLRPRPGGGLTHAKAELESGYGKIRSDWTIEEGRLRWSIDVPPNTSATVHVPTGDPASVAESGRPAAQAEGLRLLRSEPGAAVFEAGSGHYELAAKAP
jgi:alpha-L-rhamnosidase